MKKLLKYLLLSAVILLAPKVSHALTGPFVQITTSTLQPGTTNGFYTTAGRTKNMVIDSTFTVNGSSVTIGTASVSTTTLNGLLNTATSAVWTVTGSSLAFGNSIGTTTIHGIENVTGEVKFNNVASSSGMVQGISQGPNLAPISQWDGRINGPVGYTITGTTATTGTAALGANTSLTGTFTTLTAGEKVVISVASTCQAASGDLGNIGLSRGGVNLMQANGAVRVSATNGQENSCGFVFLDSPGSVNTFTYTVTFNSGSGGTFQFGEGSHTSSMVIIGYPK